MNVLLRFEDRYGCYSLFKYCKSILNSGLCGIGIENGLTCNGVFEVEAALLDNYDYVILIFDMDNSEDGMGCLNSKILKSRLQKFSGLNDKDSDLKSAIKDKLILIPVFFCFETIPLFSHELQSYLLEVEGLKATQSLEMLELFRSFYDICYQDPEVFENILDITSKNYLDNIRLKVKEITGVATEKWTIQKFYATYYKEILKTKFSKFNEGHNGFSFFTEKNKNKMKKNSDYVFETLINYKSSFNPYEILQSFLAAHCQFNTYLQWLYSVQDLKELESRTYRNTIGNIIQKIENYNTLLKGVKVQNKRMNEMYATLPLICW